MKVMKTVVVTAQPEYEKQVHDKTICDLCKHVILDGARFDVAEVEVSCKTGVSYPDGGSGAQVEFDICTKCFNDKLVPWLESCGAKAQYSTWEW